MSNNKSTNIYTLKPSYLFGATLTAGSLLIWVSGTNISFNVVVMIAVMAFYIFFIYKNKNLSISKEQKADSCYYLGFILTLIAMINTLITLDVENIGSIFNTVVRDFGLALVTTIVGLVARIIWLQLESSNAFDGEETIREKLIAEAQELETQTQRITKTLDVPSQLSATLHEISSNADELKFNLANLNNQVKAIDLKYFDDLSAKFSSLNTILERLSPIMESNIENLNQTFANSSKRIDDYNRSLGSLLEETKKTYNEVNYSLRTNAEYINKELK